MGTHNQRKAFLFLFALLFAAFNGLNFLTLKLDWTLGRLLICTVIIGAVVFAWQRLKAGSPMQALHEIGFAKPEVGAVGVASLVSALMLAFFPIYSVVKNVPLLFQPNWLWILVGMITGVGIAEETLYRGFAFNFLRERYPFWKAATISMLLFGAMHLFLLLWLPLPIAIAAILLSILAAYPTAYLFEKSNRTIWPSTILHTTAVATNLFIIPADVTVSLSLLWIGTVAVGILLIFAAGRLFLRDTTETKVRPGTAAL